MKKGKELHAGKTKKVFLAEGNDGMVIMQNQDAITAFDDPEKTKEFKTKGISATSTTCRVFELLALAGIPVAYHSHLSDIEFAAIRCNMITLEVVARRYAVGSYLKRHPDLFRPDGELPLRFDNLLVEFFLKTTKGGLIIDGKTLIKDLNPEAGEEDPFIINPFNPEWHLFHPKKPGWTKEADLEKSVKATDVVDPKLIKEMVILTKRVFWVLEAAWGNLGCRLIDFKIEFGIGPDGQLYVADVIDNDSWRMRDANWNELSKQLFRDGHELSEVENKYQLVAAMAERFRIPKQALVLWRGSPSDEFPKINAIVTKANVEVVEITMSGHKKTRLCLEHLSQLHANYPEGGVILVFVGRSNGLGPILSAHSNWPVVAIPVTLEEFPMDVWSSIRMPSDVPMGSTWPAKNAVYYALNILAQKNPIIWAMRQEAIESLDA